MNFFVANPMWAVAALTAIPLVAHLFSRTRPKKRPFPSLVLLREAARRVTRVRRPRDRWLLLLRTLAMLALALAFLQPWLLSQLASKDGSAKSVVLVIDASASMGYVDGTRTRLAQAGALAEEILDTLPANSLANVVWIRRRAESVAPDLSPNLEFLTQAVRQGAAYPEPGDIEGALVQASKQLATAQGERELIILSDFQRAAWKGANVAAPEGVKLTQIALGTEVESNVALGELTIEPPEPTMGQPAQMMCRVRNLSGEARRLTVFGEAGATRLSQAVELAPWSDALAVMPVTFSEPGTVLLKVSASEDRYPGDDARYLLVTVRGELPVSVVGLRDDPTAQAWLRAMQALDGVAARMVSSEQVAGSAARVLLISAWKGNHLDVLKEHISSGGALVVQPAGGLPAKAMLDLCGASAGESDGATPWMPARKLAPGWSVRIVSEEHPLFALFASGAYGDPVPARFGQRVAAGEVGPGFRPLLAFEDGMPALAIRDGSVPGAAHSGPIVWWNLDLGASDWAQRSAFVPFTGELLKYLGSFARASRTQEFRPGEVLRFQPDPAIDPAEVKLIDEKETVIETRTDRGPTGLEMVTAHGMSPGAYRWSAQGAVLDRAVVNFPETESDLRRLEGAELQSLGGAALTASAIGSMTRLRDGIPLWPWCVGLAALCLLAEAVILRTMRATSAAPVAKQAIKAEETARV